MQEAPSRMLSWDEEVLGLGIIVQTTAPHGLAAGAASPASSAAAKSSAASTRVVVSRRRE